MCVISDYKCLLVCYKCHESLLVVIGVLYVLYKCCISVL